MQNTNESDTRITQKKQRHWYQSQGLALSMTLIALFNMIVSTAIMGGQMESKPSILIIKNEGCSYLRQYGIPTTPYTIESTCSVEAELRPDLIGDGGLIAYQDHRIKIASNLIVAVETIQQSPWSPEHLDMMIWLGFSLLLVFSMLMWMGITFQRGLKK